MKKSCNTSDEDKNLVKVIKWEPDSMEGEEEENVTFKHEYIIRKNMVVEKKEEVSEGNQAQELAADDEGNIVVKKEENFHISVEEDELLKVMKREPDSSDREEDERIEMPEQVYIIEKNMDLELEHNGMANGGNNSRTRCNLLMGGDKPSPQNQNHATTNLSMFQGNCIKCNHCKCDSAIESALMEYKKILEEHSNKNKLKRKRELANERMRRYRQRKQNELFARTLSLIEENKKKKKQVEEEKQRQKRELSKKRSRRYRARRRLEDALWYDSELGITELPEHLQNMDTPPIVRHDSENVN